MGVTTLALDINGYKKRTPAMNPHVGTHIENLPRLPCLILKMTNINRTKQFVEMICFVYKYISFLTAYGDLK